MRSHAEASSVRWSSLAGLFALLALLLTPSMASASSLSFKETFGSANQPSSSQVTGMAVDQSSGDLYLIENSLERLSRYHADGTPSEFSALGSNKIEGLSAFGGAFEVQVAIDNSGTASDGNIYVTQSFAGKIAVFDSDGNELPPLGEYEEGPTGEGAPAPLGEACGVAVDPTGAVYVGSYGEPNGQVHKFVAGDNTLNFEAEEPICTLAAGAGPSAGSLFLGGYFSLPLKKFNASSGAFAYEVDPGPVTTETVNPANGHVFVAVGEEVKEYEASGASPTLLRSAALGASVLGVAVNGTANDIYIAPEGGPNVKVFELRYDLAIDSAGGTGTGEVQCEVDNSGTPEPCEASYPAGTELKLIPTPGAHSEFAGFQNGSGSAEACSGASCEFTLQADSEVEAPFDLIAHSLTVEPSGAGKVDAEDPPTPTSGEIAACEESAGQCQATYSAGQTVTLVATPGAGKVANWQSGCDANPSPTECEVEIGDLSDATVLVDFQTANPRKVKVQPTGEGKVSAEASPSPEAGLISECEEGAGQCEATYSEAQTATLVAAPALHHHVDWSGCTPVIGQPSKCKVTLGGSDAVVDASFVLTEFKLTVTKAGAGSGTVSGGSPAKPNTINCGTGSGCEAEYVEAEEVTLTAAPATGSAFTGWSGCTSEPSASECKVAISAAKGVTATFKPEFKLTVTKAGSGSGTVSGGSPAKPSTINCGTGSGCEHEYVEAEEVTLSAAATSGSAFTGWTGCSSEPSPTECKVTMSAAKGVTATFKPEFKLSVTKAGAGAGTVTGGSPARPNTINCGTGSGCEHDYIEAEEVTLSAAAATGSAFTGWSGCTSEPSATECKVTLSTAKGVTATFKPEFKLTVTKQGAGSGTVTGGSPARPNTINCGTGSGCEHDYIEAEEVTLSAAPTSGSAFTGWTGCTSEPSPTQCKVTLSAAKGVTATFKPEFNLSVTKGGSGSGTVTGGSPLRPATINCGTGSGCEHKYAEAEEVTLSASATSGSAFTGWTGCTSEPSATECKVTIGAAKAVTASFKVERKLTVTKAGSGSGTVSGGSTARPNTIDCGTGSGCEADYVQGEAVTLTAAPAAHNQVAWSGCTSASANSCEVTMSAAKAITATFSPIVHTLTITKVGSGSGAVSCNGAPCNPTYNEGTSLTISASADSGSSFAGFSGAGCSGTAACTVAIEANTALTATFDANPAAPTPAPTPIPGPIPTPKPLKCKKGFKKKKVKGKVKCVKVKKHKGRKGKGR